MGRDSINTAKLIALVKKRPELWDSTSSNSNRKVKYQAWNAIAEQFYCDFHTLTEEEQKDSISILMKKWKSARDCYSRDIKHRVLGGEDRKKYIYTNRMNFLYPLIVGSSSSQLEDSNVIAEEGDVDEEDSDVSEQESIILDYDLDDDNKDQVVLTNGDYELKTPKVEPLVEHAPQYKSLGKWKRKRKANSQDSDSTFNESSNITTLCSEADELFGKMIIKELAKIPEETKLNVKIEIMQVLSLAKAMGSQ